MPDKPVFPLALYRITIETDDKETAEIIRWLFSGQKSIRAFTWSEVQKHIIGVEWRERVRIEKNEQVTIN